MHVMSIYIYKLDTTVYNLYLCTYPHLYASIYRKWKRIESAQNWLVSLYIPYI